MKISRVKHITFYPVEDMFEEVEVQLHGDFTESVTDKTSFVPTEESVRSLPAGDISLDHYDYPDGKDDGAPVPIGRKRGVDLAELSEAVVAEQADVAKKGKGIQEQWDSYKAENDLARVQNNTQSTGKTDA